MSSNAVVLVVCALTLGVTGWVAMNLPERGFAVGGSGGSDGGAEERLAALERQTAVMTTTLGELRDTVIRLDRRLSRDATRAATGGSAGAAADGSAGTAEAAAGGGPRSRGDLPDSRDAGSGDVATADGHFSEAAGDAVAARLEKRIEVVAARERARGDDGKWKAPIDELADELGADAATKADLVRVFDGGRDETCKILLTQQGGGTSLIDDYAKDIRETGDGAGATQRFFKRVLTEKVPGTDETYFAALTHVHDNVEQELARRLGADRAAKLKTLRVDLLDVRTGHDPVGDALRERLQK